MAAVTSKDNVIVVQPAPAPSPVTWEGVAAAINSGAYAVLLTLAVTYLFSRKAIATALEKHFGLLETLQKVQERNADSLSEMAESQKEIQVSLINLGKKVYEPKMGFLATMDDNKDKTP